MAKHTLKNIGFNCSIPASKDFPGWTASQQFSLCKQCNSQEFTDENVEPTTKADNVVIFKVCKINEKKNHQLQQKRKWKNLEDQKESL